MMMCSGVAFTAPWVLLEFRADDVLGGFGQAAFGVVAYVERDGLTEGLEEPVQEDLRLALFVAGDVFVAPSDEFGEFVPARHGRPATDSRQGT